MSVEKSTLDQLRINRKAEPPSSKRPAFIAAFLILFILAASVFFFFSRDKSIEVRTAPARALSSGGASVLLNASGYVTARREATVSSKVTGKVMEVLIEEGMKVEAGQVLARLDDSNVKANLHLAEAQLRASQAALAETVVRMGEAERELARVQQLHSGKIATDADLDRAHAALESLRARHAQQGAQSLVAERELAVWQQQLEDTIVRAPFAGVVTAKNAQPGEMISPISAGGGFTRTGICTIVDMSSLEIEVDVNESYINRVQSGQRVEATLDSYPDWRIPAKVIAIIPTADRQKATVQVRVGFDQLDPRILPHMGVKVAFQGTENSSGERRASGVVIPKTAVQQRDGRDVVWLFQNGRTERRAITTSATRGDEVTIAAGLQPGDKVIANPPADLQDGAAVKEVNNERK